MVTSLTTSHQFNKISIRIYTILFLKISLRASCIPGAGGEGLDKPTFSIFKDFTHELPHETI